MNASERRAIVSIGLIFALRMLGLFMIVPVFSTYGTQYAHATPFLLGLAVGIYGLTQAVMQIPLSVLADRVPRKPIILAGLVLFAIGGVICATADSIYQVIIGRALAGSGAVSAVLLALLADVTREQTRTKAMAVMGMTIGATIMASFVIGPVLVASLGMSGLFWLTAVFAVGAMGLLFAIPTPTRLLKQTLGEQSLINQLRTVLGMGDLNRLHVGIFALHLTMTAIFVLLPLQLAEVLDLTVRQQGLVYLPLLLVSFAIAIPMIIVGEVKRKMRQVFLLAVGTMVLAMGVLGLTWQWGVGLVAGLGLYFIGFNALEATIPSWISKVAPVANKATAMGLNSSSQFLGAFVGGSLGGWLLTQSPTVAWLVLGGCLVVAWLAIFPIHQPPYLSSLTVRLPKQTDVNAWSNKVLGVVGVADLVVMEGEGVAYLKVDKTTLSDASRQQLSSLTDTPLDI